LALPLYPSLLCFINKLEIFSVDAWSPKRLDLSSAHRHLTIERRNFQSSSLPNFSSRKQPIYPFSTAISASSTNSDEEEEPQFIEIESLTASQVTELIELVFFQACYALSKGDLEPLRLFCVAVTTAAIKKFPTASANALIQMVNDLPPSTRPLEPQEVDLRATWIKAIYLVMGHVLDDFENSDDEVAATYGPILIDLVAIHKTGMGLNANKFVESRRDILLPETTAANPLALEEDDVVDPLQLAVVTQTINVLFTTLLVLEQEESDVPEEINEPILKTSPKQKNKKSGSSGKGFG